MKQRTFDISSNDNTLFVTEQCNNRCIMCCQPPQTADDIDALFQENIKRIKTAPKTLPIIGITGGEPTLLGERLVALLQRIRQELPDTDIHILSNGRHFSDMDYVWLKQVKDDWLLACLYIQTMKATMTVFREHVAHIQKRCLAYTIWQSVEHVLNFVWL